MLVTPVGIVTPARAMQPEKVESLMLVTPAAIATLVSEAQLRNA
jgi:hypothetical protein